MTWFEDLTPCRYFASRKWPDGCGEILSSVGWLSADHPYARGRIETRERDRLGALLQKHWDFCFFMGYHECELCRAHDSNGSLYVPGTGIIYVAPVAILHYIDDHCYLPPREFLDAVLECPRMGSKDYEAALVHAGGRSFALMTGLIHEPVLCSYCGAPLITPRAKLCHHCKMDWHDPENPRKLGAT